MKVKHDGIQKVTFGDWPVPYGITMVSDMVSALLVTTTLLIAFLLFGMALVLLRRNVNDSFITLVSCLF